MISNTFFRSRRLSRNYCPENGQCLGTKQRNIAKICGFRERSRCYTYAKTRTRSSRQHPNQLATVVEFVGLECFATIITALSSVTRRSATPWHQSVSDGVVMPYCLQSVFIWRWCFVSSPRVEPHLFLGSLALGDAMIEEPNNYYYYSVDTMRPVLEKAREC